MPGAEDGSDALEYVLALDEPDDRRRFEAALLDDAALAAAVWTQEERLRPYADAVPPRPPRRRTFAKVEARLFGREARAGRAAQRARRFWRTLASIFAATGAAAVLALVVVVTRPDLVGAREMWVAAIVRNDGAIALARLREDGRLVAQPFPLDDPGSAELWLVKEGVAPLSLGLLAAARRNELPLAGAQAAFSDGAQLVITLEPAGGSPSGAPTGPRIGAGPLARI